MKTCDTAYWSSNRQEFNAQFNVCIMGKTGAGKSTVGNMLSKNNEFTTSSLYRACTKEPKVVNFQRDGVFWGVIDTPGFGDAEIRSAETFDSIVNKLESYQYINRFIVCIDGNETRL